MHLRLPMMRAKIDLCRIVIGICADKLSALGTPKLICIPMAGVLRDRSACLTVASRLCGVTRDCRAANINDSDGWVLL